MSDKLSRCGCGSYPAIKKKAANGGYSTNIYVSCECGISATKEGAYSEGCSGLINQAIKIWNLAMGK